MGINGFMLGWESDFVNISSQTRVYRVGKTGFTAKLAYSDEDGRNLTSYRASRGKWRVRYIAATNESPFLIEQGYESGTTASYIAILRLLLVDEHPGVVKALIGSDFYQRKYDPVLEAKRAARKAAREKKEEERTKKEEAAKADAAEDAAEAAEGDGKSVEEESEGQNTAKATEGNEEGETK